MSANKLHTILLLVASIGALQVLACDPLDRFRRQIADLKAQQQQQPQQPGFMSFLSELGPQLENAKMITSLVNGISQPSREQQLTSQLQQAFQQPGAGNQPIASGLTSQPVQLLTQMTDLLRATQDRSAKAVASTQQQVQQSVQPAQQAVQNAQGGIQSALVEIGQGLQRIATNNPSLIPDVKSLYSSVSSKLNSASSSVAQAAPQPSGLPSMPA